MHVEAIHPSVRGRARFRVMGLYRSDLLRDQIESGLACREGILRVSASPLTGHVLVLYEEAVTVRSIASVLRRVVAKYGGTAPQEKLPRKAAAERHRKDGIPPRPVRDRGKVIDPGSLDRAGAKSLLRWSMEGLRSGKKEPRSRKARKEV